MAALELADDDAPRRPVTLVPGEPLVPGDVVLVIDESVAANYLDINHPDGVRSGRREVRHAMRLGTRHLGLLGPPVHRGRASVGAGADGLGVP